MHRIVSIQWQPTSEVNPENPDERELLDFHIGTSETDVRVWVEEMAKGLGYSNVVWLND